MEALLNWHQLSLVSLLHPMVMYALAVQNRSAKSKLSFQHHSAGSMRSGEPF